jgi:hypothetical protein
VAEQEQQPSDREQGKPSGSEVGPVSPAPASPGPSAAKSVPWSRRLRRWAATHPESAASLALGIAALVTAAVSTFAAVQSLNVASQALQAQTAGDQMARDTQNRVFASKVSLWGSTTALTGPASFTLDTLYVQNLNNEPLPASWLITGVQANVQFSADGFAYVNAISWSRAFILGKMGPCEEMTMNQASGVGSGPSLIFVDDSALIWYQENSGVLAQVELPPSQLKQFYASIMSVPEYPRDMIMYQQLAECS